MKSRQIRILIVFFVMTFVVRVLFIMFSGLDGYGYVPVDSKEYIDLARKALNGDFGMDLPRFIRSPLYPVFVACHMILAGAYWQQALLLTQIVLSCFCVIYIIKISDALFNNPAISILAGILSVLYVPTFYYTGAYTTEELYLFLHLSGTYYFILFLKKERLSDVFKFSFLFVLCYLLRSEIALYFPFIVLLIAYQLRKSIKLSVIAIVVFGCTFIVLTLPWGLYNLKAHNQYITSSNGGKYAFYLSNSQIAYTDLIATPKYGSKEFKAFMNNFSAVEGHPYDSIMALPVTVKQDAFLNRSLNWIKENPKKFVEVKVMCLVRFLIPGVSWKHHPFRTWFVSFMFGIPVYLLFYIGFFKAMRQDPNAHLWFLCKFISTILFVMFFLFVERYRAYSVEPFYLIYMAFALYGFWGAKLDKIFAPKRSALS